MGLKFARALPVAASLLGAVICSTAADATTVVDVSFNLTSLFGNKTIGTGSFEVPDTSAGKQTLSDDLMVTITSDPDDSFVFPLAYATFNNSGKLTKLVGSDATKGDSVVIGTALGIIGGIFTDSDYYKKDGHTDYDNNGDNENNRDDDDSVVTGFKITDVSFAFNNVTETPLPATWPMMLFGLVGVGLFVYRGAKNKAASHSTV